MHTGTHLSPPSLGLYSTHMPIVTALCGLVIGFIVGMAVEQRRHRVSFNEPGPFVSGVEHPFSSITATFHDSVTFKDKFKGAKEITDTLND